MASVTEGGRTSSFCQNPSGRAFGTTAKTAKYRNWNFLVIYSYEFFLVLQNLVHLHGLLWIILL